MKVVFITNYMNHHQLPFSDAMFNDSRAEYYFIARSNVSKERMRFGYHNLNNSRDYIIKSYLNENERVLAQKLCNEADVVIFGSAPESLLKNRLKNKKLTFKYSERIYKQKKPFYEMPLRAVKYFWQSGRHKNLYLLCASAFTAPDYAKTGTFLGKAYKWGYFPEVKKYDNISSLISAKQSNSLLWAGRMIDWKHPELSIEVARRLRDDGYSFKLDMIGDGNMRDKLEKLISKYELDEYVTLLGSMSPEEVRTHMDSSQLFLFTSDRQEGWGAVLNESMNSGCAVVASSTIGSVPFLLKDSVNGLIYRDGDFDDLYSKVKYLLDHPDVSKQFGEAAYHTLANEWNAEVAAKRLIDLSTAILKGKYKPDLFEDGPCSKAEIIKE